MEEIAVPIPEIPFVVIHTYVDKPRQANNEVVIYAMCAELWVGSKPIAMPSSQHTFGLPLRTAKEYARQLLASLYQRDDNGWRVGLSDSLARNSIRARDERIKTTYCLTLNSGDAIRPLFSEDREKLGVRGYDR